ncbi:MAG: response regulator [Chitinivibrionales bacterium]|nr:response regulator [Chitinivibrionales bacterium]MBD3356545.1 response regulator [Chitinivibrionales bacterium]
MTRVLLAAKSTAESAYLGEILTRSGLKVVATVNDGEQVPARTASLQPDVVAMSLNMPRMDGVEVTRRLMQTCPVPIVIMCERRECQSVEKEALEALQAGAVAVVVKPRRENETAEAGIRERFVEMVRLMAEVKVVTRRGGREIRTPDLQRERIPRVPVVAIGISTGGPPVLRTILGKLPRGFPAAVLIVQHISRGFLVGMRDWLLETTGYQVSIATNGELLMPGRAYLAPDDHHLGVGNDGRIMLADTPPENGLRPSVSYLFRSVLNVYGAGAIGILLTGMGGDGAVELKSIRTAGGITIAQDRESSAVYGMPGEAVARDAAMYILNPERIADVLPDFVERSIKLSQCRTNRRIFEQERKRI